MGFPGNIEQVKVITRSSICLCIERASLGKITTFEKLQNFLCIISLKTSFKKRLQSLDNNGHIWSEVCFVLNTKCCNCCHLSILKHKCNFRVHIMMDGIHTKDKTVPLQLPLVGIHYLVWDPHTALLCLRSISELPVCNGTIKGFSTLS